MPPASLLSPEFAIVPFHGRKNELDDLYAWCVGESRVRIRLCTEPGGSGKTRLGIEIARRLREEGWEAGFLSSPESLESADELLRSSKEHVLFIIDDAETRRDVLLPLLRRLWNLEPGPMRIRVLLLARSSLDWWDQLKAEGEGVGELLSGPATSRHVLLPLASSQEERTASYRLAVQAFSQCLNRPLPAEFPEGLDAELFEHPLFLHIAALIAVAGENIPTTEDGILDGVLHQQSRYWASRLETAGLPATLLAGVRRFAAAMALGGGVRDEAEALEVLHSLHAFAGVSPDVLVRIAHLFHEIYPGAH
jgi:hypothetical protein